MEAGTLPPNWADLHEHSGELSTSQDFKLAETWLNQQRNPEDPIVPREDAVMDRMLRLVAETSQPQTLGEGNLIS